MSKNQTPAKLALGTRVATSKIAFVARRYAREHDRKWYIPVKGNFSTPSITAFGGGHIHTNVTPRIENIPVEFLGGEVNDRTNKSVVAWAEERSGIIIGLERKQTGESVSWSGDGEDPGYLASNGHVDLYVVKTELRSTPFYVPMDAVTVLP